MSKRYMRNILALLLIILLAATIGCGKKEEKAPAPPANQSATPSSPAPAVILDQAVVAPSAVEPGKDASGDAVVSVNGVVLKKDELARRVAAKMKLYKDKIPAGKTKEVQDSLKKQLTEEFVMRTILSAEANAKKIVVSKKEVQEAVDQVKANIPPDKTVEDFLKENGITREDIALGIRIRKLVEKEAGTKAKPTQKEIGKFYSDNKDKFTAPETVHVRHILVTIDAKDDEKTKADKKAKIDGLRKQLVEGADFAQVAKNNSDCPSKENGGDLGEVKRGQTVKPFEDAAFSQEINAIGPVVTTEFGHHIIQVLGKTPAKAVKLEEVRDRIAGYLEQQKHSEIFNQMAARLKKNSAIIYY